MALDRTTHKPLVILRINEVLARQGLPKSSFYERIDKKLMTPPVSLGARSVGWPEHEVEQIIRALIAGCDEQQIKQLVAELTAQRQLPFCA